MVAVTDDAKIFEFAGLKRGEGPALSEVNRSAPDRKITDQICATVAQVERARVQAFAFLTETSIVDEILATVAQTERARAAWWREFADRYERDVAEIFKGLAQKLIGSDRF